MHDRLMNERHQMQTRRQLLGRAGAGVGSIALASLLGAESPAKAAFSEWLESRYDGIEALNQAWETDFTHWTELAGGVKPAH